MKVALIGTAYPYRGGLAAYNERMAREFISQGHEVTLYTFTVQYPNFLFPGKTQYSTDEAPEGLNIIRCINAVNPFNWFKVGRQIRKSNPDLVLIKYWIPFMGACFGTILRRIKKKACVICVVDNMIPHEPRLGDNMLTKYFSKPVDAFIAMSRSVLSDIEVFDKHKPKVLSPHPLFDNFGDKLSQEVAWHKLGLEKGFNYLLFFGLIRDYKGLDLLLEAMQDVRFKEKKIKLIIAGEYYSNKEKYQAAIENLKDSNRVVEVNKFIPDSEVKDYFSACDLVVQPYKSATQSGVTQIAYHFNTPMVVTDVGGLKELCPSGKVGYVVQPVAEEIANAILRYFEEEKKEEMEKNIEEEKKKYSWEILVNNIFALQKEIDSSRK